MSSEKQLSTINPHALSNKKSDYLLQLGLDNNDIEILKIYSYEGSIGIDISNKYIYIDTKLDKDVYPEEFKKAYTQVLNHNKYYEGDKPIRKNVSGTKFLFRKPNNGDVNNVTDIKNVI